MYKSVFKISKMDCPSEEQLIRMKLEGIHQIKNMIFDIPNRILIVYHTDNSNEVLQALDSLKLDTSLVETTETDECNFSENHHLERKLLWQVLGINFGFFLLELILGFLFNSMGLIADGLDMLADSIVYALALFAVGGTASRKRNIAKMAGIFQLILAVLGFLEVLRRLMGAEETPSFKMMIIISLLALIGNALCMYILQKTKSKEAHIQASMIFTSNDVVVNIGVILAGILVYFTKTPYPDLIIGTIVFFIVSMGSIRILRLK